MADVDRQHRRTAEPERVPGAMPPIHWRAVLIGVVVGQLVLLVITNGGVVLANYLFGDTSSGNLDGGVVGMSTFVAVITGGFVAARIAGSVGWYQGTIVGIGFIIVAVVFQFAQEAQIVHSVVSSPGPGENYLVNLGPMHIDEVFTGDLLALFGGAFGGFLARRR
jgi:putative membrane protein (TIGR04086 family)